MFGFVAGLLAGVGIFVGGWAVLKKIWLPGAFEVVLAVAALVLSLMKPGVLPWYVIALYAAVIVLTLINLVKIRQASKRRRR